MKSELIHTAALARIFAYDSLTARMLISHFNGTENLFSASRSELKEVLSGRLLDLTDRMKKEETLLTAEDDIAIAERKGFELVSIESPDYSRKLKECPDAPVALYKRGICNLNSSRSVAIVGTRNSTQFGQNYCRRIVYHLSKCNPKPMIISGMALGIDSCAHDSALKTGLRTVAVMGTGFDVIYPPRNFNLSEQIAEAGCLVTEYGSGMPSYPANFARRDRIIAGMSDAVILCESKTKGGGLITARLGFEYNRNIFAVPGRMDDESFSGCNMLIEQQIANIITSPDTITDNLGWIVNKSVQEQTTFTTVQHRILSYLKKNGDKEAGEIAYDLEIPFGEVSKELLNLELTGSVVHLATNRYST